MKEGKPMRMSYYADRITNLLFTALKAGDGKITLTKELSEWVYNEMFCLTSDIKSLENAAIPPEVREMPPPTGENIVDFKQAQLQKNSKKGS